MRFRRWPPVSADEGAPGTPTTLARMQRALRHKLQCRRRGYGDTPNRRPPETALRHAGRWPCRRPAAHSRLGPRGRGKRAIP
jgi:hypothetical protein